MRAKPNKAQLRNFEKLATYLEALPADYKEFDMSHFQSDAYNGLPTTELKKVTCGAVACAVGHGFNAGVRRSKFDRFWSDYSDRAFAGDIPNIWAWLFSSEWERHDNTHQGAANRIRYYLAHGVPDICTDEYTVATRKHFGRDYRELMREFAKEKING